MRVKDLISPRRWKSVTIFLLRWTLHKLDWVEEIKTDEVGKKEFLLLEPHIIEQYMFRLLACSKCVKEGECVECGCHTLGRMSVQSDYCTGRRWGPFRNKEQWEEQKESFQIEFKLFVKQKLYSNDNI